MSAANNLNQFPLVNIQAVTDTQDLWVGLVVEVVPQAGEDVSTALGAVFGDLEMAAALAQLEWVLPLPCPRPDDNVMALLPPECVLPLFRADCLTREQAPAAVARWQDMGYRVLLDGALPAGVDFTPRHALRLARHVDDRATRTAAEAAGASWFCGDYVLDTDPDAPPQDSASRKRLLALLALVARDADTRELELQVKQDPALAYHLLKLANSAAVGSKARIASFAQAIHVLGRRQLQRWLQLLLYARQQEDGPINPLLPLAALRAACMEALVKQQGGPVEFQDLAFMTGMFSLLDRLFGMSMVELCAALSLPQEVETALLQRQGTLGRMLNLVESPSEAYLQQAECDAAMWWKVQLAGFRWAIQVSRDL
ncbi:HDOD domain-containing protein [Massilia sp. TS11]|uniref:HDOD domain-containing protein n=1 Tax=Massilia sp. TS11 TaxID=2908003 RepID=UPI001EDA2BB8|nr:HDOD domain-containing protein [Massilia sp. TS11]MCG2586119.1 HDOD domain-containing protein [Massilia sp. TS11]